MPNLDHIFLNSQHESIRFSGFGGGKPVIPSRNRQEHSKRLLKRFEHLWNEVETKKQERESVSLPSKEGTYLEFKGLSGHDLITKSLENIKKGIRLLNIRYAGDQENMETIATVFIPAGNEAYFIDKIREYAVSNTKKGAPKNKPLIESIEDIRIALIESLWTDPLVLLPRETSVWCEVWLRIENNGEDEINDFNSILDDLSIERKANYIEFPERAVILCRLNRDAMLELIERSSSIAEFRIGQEAAGFWINENNSDQVDWIQSLLDRFQIEDTSTKVCILDTGVNNGHPLLNPVLTDEDCLTLDPTWGTHDHYGGSGHGTPMSGLAAYGQLEPLLTGSDSVFITHRLCSVKILPPPRFEQTPVELWGDYTAQAAHRAEIQSPEHRMVFCMAVTSLTDVDRGKPSSWSAKVDELSYGADNYKRLFIVSAGNILDYEDWKRYPDSNLTKPVQNPAQSWNALSVGAFTEKIHTQNANFSDHTPLAPGGALSPFSSTSLTWDPNKWPIKPDIVFEGGNILLSPDGEPTCHEDLELLSTSKNFALTGQFRTINATSAATAQASYLAARIMHRYPDSWPETVRALMVHSAEWKQAMLNQFDLDISKKSDLRVLSRVFGYGVPNQDKALNTTNNCLTFVAQEYIQPFEEKKIKDMHLFDLPWPKEDLLAMGDIPVKLRITLSYFVEPGPGEIGWKDKYRYPSYGLRFDLNSPLEDKKDFIVRINRAAREDGETSSTDSGSNRWLIGKNGRNYGSIHSDIWEGYASEVASCNLLAIHPVVGWWRERSHLKKTNSEARYSLIVSLETPSIEVDFYTPIVREIATRVSIRT